MAPITMLPKPHAVAMDLAETLRRRRSIRAFQKVPLALADVAALLWAAQGVTDREERRTAPSAGALYPLDLYVVVGDVGELASGVYGYDPRRHALRMQQPGDPRQALAAAASGQDWIATAPAVLVFAAEFARTTVKYGQRGERYAHIEAGHAAENACLQAVALGFGSTVVGAFADQQVQQVLGLPIDSHPLILLPVGPPA